MADHQVVIEPATWLQRLIAWILCHFLITLYGLIFSAQWLRQDLWPSALGSTLILDIVRWPFLGRYRLVDTDKLFPQERVPNFAFKRYVGLREQGIFFGIFVLLLVCSPVLLFALRANEAQLADHWGLILKNIASILPVRSPTLEGQYPAANVAFRFFFASTCAFSIVIPFLLPINWVATSQKNALLNRQDVLERDDI